MEIDGEELIKQVRETSKDFCELTFAAYEINDNDYFCNTKIDSSKEILSNFTLNCLIKGVFEFILGAMKDICETEDELTRATLKEKIEILVKEAKKL